MSGYNLPDGCNENDPKAPWNQKETPSSFIAELERDLLSLHTPKGQPPRCPMCGSPGLTTKDDGQDITIECGACEHLDGCAEFDGDRSYNIAQHERWADESAADDAADARYCHMVGK